MSCDSISNSSSSKVRDCFSSMSKQAREPRTSPRKFAEKIALLNKKESETNAAFEKIIKEVEATTAQLTPLLIPVLNQIANRQRRRSSTTLKRSLSCRASPGSRDRSLSSACIATVGHYLVNNSRGPSKPNSRRSSYTTNGQLPINQNDNIQPNQLIYNDDAYDDESSYKYTINNHMRRRSGYLCDDDLDQPYSLPVHVPDIKIFSIDDDHGNNYAEDEYACSPRYQQQQVTESSSYREPFHSMGPSVGGRYYHDHDQQQQQHQPLQHYHQQPMNNRLTSTLNKPYAMCNFRSLPDMTNVGFGSSDEISVYGSPYGDESSPLVAYETHNHANYCAPTATATTSNSQHQQLSGQTYRTSTEPPSSGPMTTHTRLDQPSDPGVPISMAVPAIQLQDQNITLEAQSSSAVHETGASFQEDTFHQAPQENCHWGELTETHRPHVETHCPRQQQQISPSLGSHSQGPLVKSASSNALYETGNNWNDTSSASGYVEQGSYSNSSYLQPQHNSRRLSNQISRSYNDGLYLAGQNSTDPHWAS